nr:MAG: hypothetical protein TU35_07770 [Thermoproteus sp. AZ2]
MAKYAAAFVLAAALVASLIYTSLSIRPMLIFWIVPWGSLNLGEIPQGSAPGVVVVIPCTPNAGVDFTQFELSLALIQSYRNWTPLFINLFCSAQQWRGQLTEVNLSYASTFLNALKGVIGDGQGVYIGFSEMSACISNTTCTSELAAAYRQLAQMFPEAHFFYYGTSSEPPSDIIRLAREAGVIDLVGEDLYDYSYSEGELHVPKYFLDNLEELRSSGLQIMVGEIGFRICDAEGYIQPWNWQLPVKSKNCTATIEFYRQAISQLEGLRPTYIGIWAWNDPTYGVALSGEVKAFFYNLSNIGR